MKTEMAEADLGELLQLFDSVEAKQYKRPDMNGDLRLGFASDDFAGTKWKNLTGTARWSDGTEMVTLDYSHLTSVLWGVCKGFQARLDKLEEQVKKWRPTTSMCGTPASCTALRGSGTWTSRSLKPDVGRQVQAPRPRALGKSAAAEGPNDRLQADLIDFSQNTKGKTKYGLVVMDVFTREAAVESLQRRAPQAGHTGAGGRGAQLRVQGSHQRRPELQPPVRGRAAAAGRGLHDGPQHREAGDPAEAGPAGAPGQRQRRGQADEARPARCGKAAGRLLGAAQEAGPAQGKKTCLSILMGFGAKSHVANSTFSCV